MKKRYRCISKLEKNNKLKYTIIFIIIIAIIISIAFIEFYIKNKEKSIPIYNYTIKKSDNYELLLKPNDFYTTQTLPAGGYYASNSIKSFAINLKYDFKSDKKSNIEYNYNITANLIGTIKNINEEDKEIFLVL